MKQRNFKWTAAFATLNLILSFSAAVNAQVTIGAAQAPPQNAVLQVVKTNDSKTIIAPVLTAGEGNAIVPDKDLNDGMFYYNSSTGCFSYYNAAKNQWYNLCGTPPPAQGQINDCGQIRERGIYIAGSAFTTANYLSVPVTVTSPGTYEIIANTSPDNGYYYQASGTFLNTGTFVVNLMGMGTPLAAQIDHSVITFNGVQSVCDKTIEVKAPNPSYRIISAQVAPPYYATETPLNNPLKWFVSVTMQVSVPGEYQLIALDKNGVGFSGSGQIEDASGYNPAGNFPQIVTVQIPAHGNIPAQYAGTQIDMNISDLNSATPSNVNFQVAVAAVSFSVDCANTADLDLTSISGENKMKQNEALTAPRSITVPVTVTATGNTNISGVVAGVQFTSGDITLTAGVTTSVVLTAAAGQAPNSNGVRQMSFSSSVGGLETVCTIDVEIAASIAHITSLAPNPTSYNGTIAKVGAALTASVPNIVLNYNCTVGGTYVLTSSAENGMTFSSAGTLLAGTGSIMIAGSGTPVKNGRFTYTLDYDSDGDGTNDKTATFTVTYAYRAISVLGLCGNLTVYGYAPNTNNTSRSSYKILNSATNFGANGTFPTVGIRMFGRAEPSSASTLRSLINDNKVDIIVVGFDYTPSQDCMNVLRNFVNNKKGAVLFLSESQSNTDRFFQTLYNIDSDATGQAQSNSVQLANLDNPILNGPFGDIRGRYTGVDAAGTSIRIRNVPSAMTVLSGSASNAFITFDAAKGVMWCGDGGFLSSETYNIGSSNICPLWINQSTGAPVTNTAYSPDVENSRVYTNFMAWAMEYIIQNINADYNVQ